MLLIRSARNRTGQQQQQQQQQQQSKSPWACRSLYRSPPPPPPPLPLLSSSSGGVAQQDQTAARAGGTTWSELVSRCHRSREQDSEGPEEVSQGSGRAWSASSLRPSFMRRFGGITMVKKRSAAAKATTTTNNNNGDNNSSSSNNNNNTLKHPKRRHHHKHHDNGTPGTYRYPQGSDRNFLSALIFDTTPIMKVTIVAIVSQIIAAVVAVAAVGYGVGYVALSLDWSWITDYYYHHHNDNIHNNNGNGGWRRADEETLRALDSGTCTIDRVPARDMDHERFERDFRYKRPVILTFPDGARDWTDPQLWTLESLKRSYGEWKISSGDSLEIVRRGGNGDMTSSFDDFVGHLMGERKATDEQPAYYMFDRAFYKDTELPKTLKLPPYLSNDESLNDSIFFLGTSGTGVVFHKHADTWNAVVYGKKRWFLYPITNTPPGGVYHGFHMRYWYERVYPNLTASQRPLECVQQGGEILYLPEGFYHATLNIGDTVAVAMQKKQPTLVAEKLTYQVTALSKELEKQNVDKKAVRQKLLDTFLKLRELLPGSSEVAMKLGEQYGELGHHRRAVDLTGRHHGPLLCPGLHRSGEQPGQCEALVLGRVEEAEAALTRAVKLSPEAWDVYKDYGVYLMKAGRYAEAIPVLSKGAALNPALIPFWSYLKAAQQHTGDTEGARHTQAKIDQLTQQLGA
ncbi:uncharacterized protein LOC143299581 [Babylonia areolata]|uniref:uncharacterized protein LOC143299581 n=1 Tax=Babylonia areolata TaxID=304850 RepID=UPI003FD04956